MKKVGLASSLANIGKLCPAERLGPASRYVVMAGLRLGDGGPKDELAARKEELCAILGRWYLPRGYTLVLDGDVEDMRRFWLKDIAAAWSELYAVFSAFAEAGRLRKIVGERDLSLLRLVSYPYALSHGLRLELGRGSIFVAHGHQASRPFIGRDYLSDYMVRWLGYPRRKRTESERAKGGRGTEARLAEAGSRMGSVLIEGHTRRPLFESLPRAAWDRGPAPGLSPCLFSPGRLLGSRSLRVIEIEGSASGSDIILARWAKQKADSPRGACLGWARVESRRACLDDLVERVSSAAARLAAEPEGAMG